MAAESAEGEGGMEGVGRGNFVTAKPGKEVGLSWGVGSAQPAFARLWTFFLLVIFLLFS